MNARTVLAPLCALALLPLAACTGGSGTPRPSPSKSGASAAPVLRAAWTEASDDRWDPGITDTTPWAWTTPTAVIVPRTKGLTAYAMTTGRRLWSVDLPDEICTIADRPSPSGIGAVLLGKADDDGCASAAAVDLTSGRLRWTKSISKISAYGYSDVAVGDDAVVASNECDGALSLSTATGRRQFSLPTGTRKDGCGHTFASDGTTIVGSRLFSRHGAFLRYDARSGRQLSAQPVQADAGHRDPLARVKRVVSSSPLVIDASVNQHRFLRYVDAAGHARSFGRESNDSYPPVLAQRVGSNFAVQYGSSSDLFAYDPRSGRQTGRALLRDGEYAVGVRGSQVISLVVGVRGVFAGKIAVFATDPVSARRQVLGTVTVRSASGPTGHGVGYDASVVGSTLVLPGTDDVAAYRLPASGPPESRFATAVKWAVGDVHPTAAADLCLGVSAATRRALHFAEPALPAPANCHWVESLASGAIEQLSVSASAVEPTSSQRAVTLAHARVVAMTKADPAVGQVAGTPVTGVGDEAWAVAPKPDSPVQVVIRRVNVVIVVTLSLDATGRKTSTSDLIRSAELAAKDAVAEVDRRR